MKRIILISLLIPLAVLGRAVSRKNSGNFTPTQTTQLVFSANRNRQGLVISNKGTDAVLVNFGSSAAGTTSGLKIAAGSNIDFNNPPADAIYVVLAASTGTNSIDVLEFE